MNAIQEGSRVRSTMTGDDGSVLSVLPQDRYELPVRVRWDVPKYGELPCSWEAVEDLVLPEEDGPVDDDWIHYAYMSQAGDNPYRR